VNEQIDHNAVERDARLMQVDDDEAFAGPPGMNVGDFM